MLLGPTCDLRPFSPQLNITSSRQRHGKASTALMDGRLAPPPTAILKTTGTTPGGWFVPNSGGNHFFIISFSALALRPAVAGKRTRRKAWYLIRIVPIRQMGACRDAVCDSQIFPMSIHDAMSHNDLQTCQDFPDRVAYLFCAVPKKNLSAGRQVGRSAGRRINPNRSLYLQAYLPGNDAIRYVALFFSTRLSYGTRDAPC